MEKMRANCGTNTIQEKPQTTKKAQEMIQPTISEVADLQIAVKADHGHGDEAPAAEEEPRPAVETAAFPAKQPAV